MNAAWWRRPWPADPPLGRALVRSILQLNRGLPEVVYLAGATDTSIGTFVHSGAKQQPCEGCHESGMCGRRAAVAE